MHNLSLDETDIRLLAALQRDAHLTSEALGRALNLSPSQADRKLTIQLREAGDILGITVDHIIFS